MIKSSKALRGIIKGHVIRNRVQEDSSKNSKKQISQPNIPIPSINTSQSI